MREKQVTRLTGQIVYLRRLVRSDLTELTSRYASSKSHLAGLADRRFDRARFESMLAAAKKPTNESFVICNVEDDAIVGRINLSQIFMGPFKSAYLGYELFAGFTGNGYMTEAVQLVLRFAFTRRRLHRIEGNVQPENFASIRVLQRCGFVKEGFSEKYLKVAGKWRDHERWAITKEVWTAL